MFSNPSHYEVFQKLEKAMRHEHTDAFLALLHIEFQSLCKSGDELRMLFYITIYSPQKIFSKALRYYKKQKAQIEGSQERIEYIVRDLGHRSLNALMVVGLAW